MYKKITRFLCVPPNRAKKRLIIPKLSILFITASFLLLSVATHAQKVTFNKKNATLVQLLTEMRKQTGYNLFWSENKVSKVKPRDFSFTNATIKEVLEKALEGLPLTYELQNKTIMIKEKDESKDSKKIYPEINGCVVDEKGEPMPGATVLIKGTRIAILSDQAGNFSIKMPIGCSVLMVSCIGSNMQEINVKDKSYVRIAMESAEQQLKDVVVIAYGTQQKKDVVTAVSTIKADEIVQENQINLGNALQGKVNGAIIVSSGGTPGKNRPTIMIRGNNPKQPPLIVVDGVPRYQDLGTYPTGGIALNGLTLDDINPDEVESISVLKDNAATAVYGTRGAFGVILVTTKRGKIGKPKFNYSGSYSLDEPSRFPKMFESYKYALVQNEYNKNSGLSPAYSDAVLEIIRDQSQPFVYGNTNLYDVLVQRHATQQSHSVSVSGGSEGVSYYINGSLASQKGIVEAFDYKRYTLQSNIDIKISPDIKLGLGTSFRNSSTGGAFINSGDAVFNSIFVTPPLTPVYNKDGSLYSNTEYNNKWANTIPDLSGYNLNRSNNISIQANLEYVPAFLKGFTFRLNNSINFNAADYKAFQKFYSAYVPDVNSPTGYRKTAGSSPNNLRENLGNGTQFNTDIGFDYLKRVGVHRFGLTVLGTNYYANSISTQVYRDGIIANLETINSGRTLNQTTGGSETESGKLGGVVRFSYDFNSKYSLEYAMRADASDNFPPGNRWGFFSGGAVAWRLSEEKFIKNNFNFIQDLKIRVSVGVTGIDNLSPFNYFYTYNVATSGLNAGGGYAFGGTYQPSFILNTRNVPNKDVTWGKSVMRNIGLDFSLWKGLLSGTFDMYDKKLSQLPRAKDLAIPATFGIGAPMFNFAKESYSGYEISLTNNTNFGHEMSLQTTFNLSYNKSRVVDYGEPENIAPYLKKEGYSIQSNRFYKALGIFQTQEEITGYPVIQDGVSNSTIKPGDIKYADLNGDNKIDVNDQVVYNDVNIPPFSGGLNMTFRYKSLSLNAFLQGAGGNLVNYVPGNFTDYGYDNSWRPDNTGAPYPRISNSINNSTSQRRNTLYMRNGNYVRFKNLKLAYSLPGRLLKHTGLSNVAISVAALNLWAISEIKDIDPEVAPTSDLNNGGYYPIQRNYSIGLNIGL